MEAAAVGKTIVPVTMSPVPSAALRTRFRFRPLPDVMSIAKTAGAKQILGPRRAAAAADEASRGSFSSKTPPTRVGGIFDRREDKIWKKQHTIILSSGAELPG